MFGRPKVILIIFSLIMISFCFHRARGSNGYVDVSVSEAKDMMDSNSLLLILDVRTQSEYNSGHIRNARLIPHTELEARIGELEEDRLILVYCHSGGRSAAASQILVDNGFTQVYNMFSGILAWMDDDYPVYIRYSSIQQAINNASHGAKIFVSSGTYLEHVVINKSLTLTGENKDTTIIDGGGTGHVLLVETVNNTFISDLTIRGSGCGCAAKSGIHLQNSYNSSVTGNIVTDNGYGIQLKDSNSCTISGNIIANNSWPGIALYWSHENVITSNDIKENFWGIKLSGSSDNKFIHNNIIDNRAFQIDPSGETANIWDDGYPSGGNYWSDYNGTDGNRDAIGDTPYTIDENNKDSYPLMTPYVSPEEIRFLYYDLSMKYNNLLAYYQSLNTTYQHLLDDYVVLVANYTGIQVEYDSLLSNFNSLNSTYSDLNATYNELRSKQGATINELNNIRNLMYIFMAATIILLGTTVNFVRGKLKS